MREQLSYFAGERLTAMAALAIGLTTFGAGVALYLGKGSFRGMALPLAFFALFEVGVGVAVWATLGQRAATAESEHRRAPAEMAAKESARIEGVLRTFALLKITEMILIAAGVALTYAFRRSDFVYAVGVGLVLQGSTMLVFDLIAARRTEHYLNALRGLLGPGPS